MSPVQRDFFRAGQASGEEVERMRRAGRDAEPGSGSEEREAEDLRKKLKDNGAAGCSQRIADGNLVFALCSARKQERGDVGAGDEQQ